MDHPFAPTPRRGFLARVAAAVAAAGALPLVSTEAAAQAPQASDHDKWLEAVNGKHRQLFDMSAVSNGLPLIHILNYFGTYNSAYGAKPGEVNAIGTFYGMTTLFGVNDAMWAKYNLGSAINVNDHKGGAPATRNPWRTDPEITLGAKKMVMAPASIEALQKLGTTFILCNNALTFFAGEVAGATNQQPAAVLTEFKANMLPGVVLVPAMVIAIQKAQDKGIAYNKQ
jgi:intracellular sulfur oxidation DsrE/DsrF family protein